MLHFDILLQCGLRLEVPNTPWGSDCLRDYCNPMSGHNHPLPSLHPHGLFLHKRAVTQEAQRIKVLWAQLIALRRSFAFLYKAGPGGKRICQCISDGLKSCRGLTVPTRINLSLLLCKQLVFVRNCHLLFQTRLPCFRPSFCFFLLAARKQLSALSHFAAGWVTEGFFSPFLKRSMQLAAAVAKKRM